MNDKTYDLFGFDAADLDSARVTLERVLELTLVLHESEFSGGEYYRLGDAGREHFVLEPNFYAAENIWTEPDHRDIRFLLQVNETGRGRELEARLAAGIPGLRLIRREAI